MAFRVGVTGLPNTGKSFAWKFYRGDDVFAILPSSKILHARREDGSLLSKHPLRINGKTLAEIAEQTKLGSEYAAMNAIMSKNKPVSEVETSGHYVQCSDVRYVQMYKLFVSKYMPQIKITLNPDFTHYISFIIQSEEFQRRKSGGEAFARFWELAADTLRNVILVADKMRPDMLDITEFHSVWNEDLNQFEIYTPAGNMLVDKFKPETYFDIMLYSYVIPYEQVTKESDRFKFMVIKREGYDGRSMGLFEDVADAGLIPNNMGMVIERLREYLIN